MTSSATNAQKAKIAAQHGKMRSFDLSARVNLLVPVLDDAQAGTDRLGRLPDGERRPETAAFLIDFLVEHRRAVGLVLFDRGGLPAEVNGRVDELVAALGSLLGNGEETDAAHAWGEGTVLGIAAIVQRRPQLADDDLRLLLRQVLDRPSIR